MATNLPKSESEQKLVRIPRDQFRNSEIVSEVIFKAICYDYSENSDTYYSIPFLSWYLISLKNQLELNPEFSVEDMKLLLPEVRQSIEGLGIQFEDGILIDLLIHNAVSILTSFSLGFRNHGLDYEAIKEILTTKKGEQGFFWTVTGGLLLNDPIGFCHETLFDTEKFIRNHFGTQPEYGGPNSQSSFVVKEPYEDLFNQIDHKLNCLDEIITGCKDFHKKLTECRKELVTRQNETGERKYQIAENPKTDRRAAFTLVLIKYYGIEKQEALDRAIQICGLSERKNNSYREFRKGLTSDFWKSVLPK